MAQWEVRTADGTTQVEGANWLLAVGSVLAERGGEGFDLSCLICDVQADGVIHILDPSSDTPMLVRRMADLTDAPRDKPAPVRIQMPLHTTLVPAEPEPESEMIEAASAGIDALDFAGEVDFDDADLAFLSEVPKQELPAVHTGPPDGLAELVFERGMDVAGAESIEAAADAALQILTDLVPCESSAVLYASINDPHLRFLAVTGPQAAAVAELTVPFGQGYAGFSHDTGADLLVHDVGEDTRHHDNIDEATGYRTRAVLVAALRDSQGDIHGCLELLNPTTRFERWHRELAHTVATTLADRVAAG